MVKKAQAAMEKAVREGKTETEKKIAAQPLLKILRRVKDGNR